MYVKDWDTAAIAAYAFDPLFKAVSPDHDGSVDYSRPRIHRLTSDGRQMYFTSIADLEDDSFFGMYTEHLQPDDVIIHAGAYCGVQTIDFSHRVGSGGRVIAFEPDRDAFAALSRNVSQHALSNVVLLQKGLWDKASVITFFATASMNASFTNAPSHSSEAYDVATVTIDGWLLDNAVACDRVSLVKIDVEGAELAVLKGAELLLRNGRPRIFIDVHLHSDQRLDAKCSEFLQSCGYVVQWVGPQLGTSMKFCLATKR
jgi:FkbM family methyltransferase